MQKFIAKKASTAQFSRNQIIGAASSVCLLPSIILTVIPTLARDPGVAVCMAIGVLALPLIPFALRRRADAGSRALLIVLGSVLLLYNFSNALDALNRGHAVETGDARGRMTLAAALAGKIKELEGRKVSTASVEAAQRARDAECRIVGAVCRAREDALASAHRAYRERAEAIEGELDKARDELRRLGPVEKTADPTASQLAGLAGLFWTSAATSGDAISTNRPIFKAWVVEFMGGLMPWVLVTIFGTVQAAPVLPKSKRKSAEKVAAENASKDSVLAWHKDRIEKKAGRKLRAGTAFKDYKTWCTARKLKPTTLSDFGNVMKNELGTEKTTGNNRVTYVGIGLKTQLKVVA